MSAVPTIKVMKRAAPIAMALVVMATAAQLLGAAVASADDYRFPIANPLKASLIPAGYRPHRTNYLVSLLEVRADRRNVPRFQGKNKLVLALFSQRGPAHLVFVIPGVGSNALSESALMLAEQFHGMGFHSVTLPDPLSWQYTLGVSESALPGYLPLDAGEYYELLKEVAGHLKKAHRLGITGYSVAGYSFGGLLTGFLTRLDGERRAFDFERAVIINPAIDIRHAIQVVDGFFASGHSIHEGRRSKLLSSMVDSVIRLRNRPLTDDLVRWAADQWAFSDDEMKWIIGRSFRGATTGTIFASRQIRAHGLLAPPGVTGAASARGPAGGPILVRRLPVTVRVPVPPAAGQRPPTGRASPRAGKPGRAGPGAEREPPRVRRRERGRLPRPARGHRGAKVLAGPSPVSVPAGRAHGKSLVRKEPGGPPPHHVADRGATMTRAGGSAGRPLRVSRQDTPDR